MADPSPPTLPEGFDPKRCKARTRSGKQCGNAPILGASVCRMHGGSAPQVRRKAALRLAELVDPAINRLARVLADPMASEAAVLRAVENVLDRTGHPRRADINLPDAKEQLAARLAALREELDDPDDDPEPEQDAP